MRKLLLIVGIVGATAVCWGLTVRRRRVLPTAPAAKVGFVRPPYDPTLSSRTVAACADGVRADPVSAMGYARLSGAYLQRCRETGNLDDALQAERCARRSLALRTKFNSPACQELSQSLLTQHRFAESLAVAKRALALSPSDTRARLLVAQNELETGDYDMAKAGLRSRPPGDDEITGFVLTSRLLEFTGFQDQSLAEMRRAQALADAMYDLPRENVAWYHMRVGDLLAAMGRATEAARCYTEALDLFPRDYRTMTSLTRLAAGRGDWNAVIMWGQRAAAIVPNPEVLALIGDAYSAKGMPKEAEAQYHLVEVIGKLSRAQGTVYDRQRAMFCADHNRDLDEALTLARRELRDRHDVYAYDTLAWVALKKGLLAEAVAASKMARAENTQDARIMYHAALIAEAAGDRPGAKALLRRALAVNPYFLPFAPQNARDLLASWGP